MAQANVDLIQSLYEAFGRGDAATVLGGMDPGIIWNEAEGFPYADRNPYVGPMAVAEGVFGRIGVEWDGFRAVTSELLDEGCTVIALGRYHGTFRATGRTINAQFAHAWRLSERESDRLPAVHRHGAGQPHRARLRNQPRTGRRPSV